MLVAVVTPLGKLSRFAVAQNFVVNSGLIGLFPAHDCEKMM